ncbi:TnsD family transposase [Peribacillus frigoritolerans]
MDIVKGVGNHLVNELPFFPSPHNDEILYSIYNRYHFWSGNLYNTHTFEDLFGRKTVPVNIAFPSYLRNLQERLPVGSLCTPEKLINDHSLFPLFRPFFSIEKNAQIIDSMYSSESLTATFITGYNQSVIPKPSFYRICKVCYEDDMRNIGEGILRRTHQVFGVNVCPHHEVPLTETQISTIAKRSNSDSFIPIGEGLFKKDIVFQGPYQHHIDIAKQVYNILNSDIPMVDKDEINNRYLCYLRQKGYCTFNGTIKEKKIVSGFLNFYGEEFLKSLKSGVTNNSRNNWVAEVLRRKSLHPLRHILLVNFLGLNIKEFFVNNVEAYNPFGKGPWICFNAATNHFFEANIYNCEIKRDSNSTDPIGTFTCECGFKYSRKGPDTTRSDKFKIGKVISYGSVWEQKLIELRYKRKKTIKEVANILNVTPLTVIRKLSKVKAGEVPIDMDCPILKYQDKKEKYRYNWRKIVDLNSTKSRAELRELAKAEYIWLYRNDRVWLEQNSPNISTKINGNYVDWRRRDIEYLELTKSAVAKILTEQARPKRITITLIGNLIGKSHIFQYGLKNLRLTNEYLESVIETVEDVRVRRIGWAIDELIRQGQVLTYSKIRKKASLSISEITPQINQILCAAIENE